jgi:hypothetical protein
MSIKLNEHIVTIDGKPYIPAEIAMQAVIEAIQARENLDNAFKQVVNIVENTD